MSHSFSSFYMLKTFSYCFISGFISSMGEYDEVSSGDLVDLPNEIRASRFAEARLKEIDALQQVGYINAIIFVKGACTKDVHP